MTLLGALTSLPVNLTDSARILARFRDGLRDELVSTELSGLPFESALPVRSFFAWPGKRNYEGSWWSSTVGGHVGFESLLERNFLMLADHDTDVIGIVSQPFAVLWPHDTEAARGHVPDFFVRLRDGGGRVVDVRHPDRLSSAERQFEMTARMCQAVGWDYEVFSGMAEPRAANLRWLSGYRQDRFAPSAASLLAILEAFRAGASMATGVRCAARRLKTDPSVVQANVLHLAYRGLLDVDLGRPLSLESPIASSQGCLADVLVEEAS